MPPLQIIDRVAEEQQIYEGIEAEILRADLMHLPINPKLLGYYFQLQSRRQQAQPAKSRSKRR
jgi:hypothetical protein